MNRMVEGRRTRRRPGLERARIFCVFGLAAVLSLAACEQDDGGDPVGVEDPSGVVGGQVFLDADGNGEQSAGDQAYTGLAVQVVTLGGGIVAADTTDEEGGYLIDAVPVGSFRLRVDPETLPDSVEVFGLPPELFVLSVGETLTFSFRVGFPTFSLEAIRELPSGRRVFTQGFALNARAPAGDGVVHFQEGSVYLRATNVDRGNFGPGDSVRVVGRTSRDVGLPILENVQVLRLISGATLLDPVALSTEAAARAGDGELDAALIRISDATVTDVDPTDEGFLVTADDGSGPIELFMREFLGFSPAPFVPDATRFVDAVGLLVPVSVGSGEVRWRITPRTTGDIDLEAIAP